MSQIMKKNFIEQLKKELGNNFSLSWETDCKGVQVGWCKLDLSTDITNVALIVARVGARLMTITAYNVQNSESKSVHQIAYHIDLDGSTCTVTIEIPRDGGEVISITPILKTADWTERELQELYDIKVVGHPNPKRLFLDESIDEGVMNRLTSLSEAMSGASSKTLWEKVISSNLEEDTK